MSHPPTAEDREGTVPLQGVIDRRCFCERCESRTKNIYRMVSHLCDNCHGGPFLLLIRTGDKPGSADCPICGNYQTVSAHRLATPDEIPAAVGDKS